MSRVNNHEAFIKLRKSYPFFVYEYFKVNITYTEINITFCFNLSDKVYFKPEIKIPVNDEIHADKLSAPLIENLAFHLGMIEMLSYWKAACAPEIIVKPYQLSDSQIAWWKKIYFNGLGEFFFLNSITTDVDSFVNIKTQGNAMPPIANPALINANIIPMGGGKDSALTYALLKETGEDNLVFFLNPQHIPTALIKKDKSETKYVKAFREISPELLELNRQGFLNGHTPFSALLAFLSLIISALTNRKNIVLSNESSANEPTIPCTEINHQYSKTYAFENDFRNYIQEFVSPSFNYFSFLRPLNELQIASLFSQHPQFFDTFRSCNAGSKQGIWCCNCSKCLFTYILLSAFIDEKRLVEIFGENLYQKNTLKLYFDQLTGLSETKPFDCVGTIDEVNTALVMAIRKYPLSSPLPYLLSYYKAGPLWEKYHSINPQDLLRQFNEQHFLKESHVGLLKRRLGIVP
ncbi:MAG: hypothetical protein BWY70_00355 [Bacteroidetes bacterium ADurb.Bin408]|nr:MAG: hypothetical protein BWY70_00355 [Bacteroidetes bacterium ADurb.Bin408]